jgi:hypothetical protein
MHFAYYILHDLLLSVLISIVHLTPCSPALRDCLTSFASLLLAPCPVLHAVNLKTSNQTLTFIL